MTAGVQSATECSGEASVRNAAGAAPEGPPLPWVLAEQVGAEYKRKFCGWAPYSCMHNDNSNDDNDK